MSTTSGSVPEPEGYEEEERAALKVMLAYYQYAGSQLSLSLRQRDYVVLLYLAAVATVFGTALAQDGVQVSLLVLIPFLSLGAAMLSMLHHVRVGAVSTFRERVHNWFVLDLPAGADLPKHQDSLALLEGVKDDSARMVKLAIKVNQVLAHFLLILTPALTATFLIVLTALGNVDVEPNSVPSAETMQDNTLVQVGIFVACGACILLSVYILYSAVAIRADLYKRQVLDEAITLLKSARLLVGGSMAADDAANLDDLIARADGGGAISVREVADPFASGGALEAASAATGRRSDFAKLAARMTQLAKPI